jgi:hypothetical protein
VRTKQEARITPSPRQCAPFSLRSQLANALGYAWGDCVTSLIQVGEQANFSEEEHRYYEAMCKAMAEVAMPYVVKCFGAIYDSPSPQVDATTISAPLRGIYEKEEPGALLDIVNAVSASLLDDPHSEEQAPSPRSAPVSPTKAEPNASDDALPNGHQDPPKNRENGEALQEGLAESHTKDADTTIMKE